MLDQPTSRQAIVLTEMKRLIKIRSEQSAFHPNATQFTLQLGDALFGFWRQNMDRSQSIFAIHNLTSEKQSIATVSLNLIGGDHWTDLLSGDIISDLGNMIEFSPYQCRWITNRQ